MKDDHRRRQAEGSTGARKGSSDKDGMTVGAAAGLLGISVRTLHHWDAIGLVRPSGRSLSGYRLYSQDDVSRLQQALVYRATGMPLARVKEALDETGMDAWATWPASASFWRSASHGWRGWSAPWTP